MHGATRVAQSTARSTAGARGGARRSFGELDVDDDVAARRVGVRADLVRRLEQRLRLSTREARELRGERDLEAEARARRADADLCRDLDGARVDLLAARDVAERAAEACGVARCELLLRVRGGATGATA